MEWYLVALGLVALLIAFISLGLPIPFALAAASLPFLWAIHDPGAALASIQMMLWGTWINYILLAVPLFIFLAELVGRSEIGPRLYDLMHNGIRVRGSAAYGSVAANAAFGSISGSSMVGALTIGGIALPQMLRLGYGKGLASGSLAAGGTLSVLIPPSLILLYYGVVTDTSIGKLFIAGAIPGIILALLFMVVIFLWQIIRPQDVPAQDRGSTLTLAAILVGLFPVVILGGLISGAIYAGIATPTEASAVAVVVAAALAFTIGRLTVRAFVEALLSTMRIMGYVGLLLGAALLFGFVLNTYRIPQQFAEMIGQLSLSPAWILALVLVFYLLIGLFLEPAAITFITVPTMFPIVKAAGYDPVWFGVLFTVTMEIAVLTPPVGLNLYVIQAMVPDKLTVRDVVYGSAPFVVAACVLILLLITFPSLALWLPRSMG